ncbi:GNAT family N-acetyltransferase [Streptomyces sp. NPDC056910]|uniref:GNAT family N-acetyltransferase n=1 Tax=Streptomyces sp. NPDC056910 TaxID=3345964 RepID=UPI0036C883EC
MALIRRMSGADRSMTADLLASEGLGSDGDFFGADGIDVLVADNNGRVVGVVEYDLYCDFGREQGRAGHLGEQAWIYNIAVAASARRGGLGRALLTEVAQRAQEAGRTFLALVPQDGADVPGRRAFFQACGLTLIEPETPGAAWGCPVTDVLCRNIPESRPS